MIFMDLENLEAVLIRVMNQSRNASNVDELIGNSKK